MLIEIKGFFVEEIFLELKDTVVYDDLYRTD